MITREVTFDGLIKRGRAKKGAPYCVFRVRALDGWWKVNCYGVDAETIGSQEVNALIRVTTKVWPTSNKEMVRANEIHADSGCRRSSIEKKYGSYANYTKSIRAMQQGKRSTEALANLVRIEESEGISLLPKL